MVAPDPDCRSQPLVGLRRDIVMSTIATSGSSSSTVFRSDTASPSQANDVHALCLKQLTQPSRTEELIVSHYALPAMTPRFLRFPRSRGGISYKE